MHVQWLNDSVPLNLLPPVRNNTALMSLVVDEDTHGRSFRCTGVDSSGKAIFKQYNIIARGETMLKKYKSIGGNCELWRPEADNAACHALYLRIH